MRKSLDHFPSVPSHAFPSHVLVERGWGWMVYSHSPLVHYHASHCHALSEQLEGSPCLQVASQLLASGHWQWPCPSPLYWLVATSVLCKEVGMRSVTSYTLTHLRAFSFFPGVFPPLVGVPAPTFTRPFPLFPSLSLTPVLLTPVLCIFC